MSPACQPTEGPPDLTVRSSFHPTRAYGRSPALWKQRQPVLLRPVTSSPMATRYFRSRYSRPKSARSAGHPRSLTILSRTQPTRTLARPATSRTCSWHGSSSIRIDLSFRRGEGRDHEKAYADNLELTPSE